MWESITDEKNNSNSIVMNNYMTDINTHFKNLLRLSNTYEEIFLLDLKCLKSKKEIKCPVRSAECIHLECYDENYLRDFFKSNESFLCIKNKCGKFITNRNTVKDRFLYAIMKNRSYKSGMSIRLMKSSGNWSFVENETESEIKIVKEENVESLSLYVNYNLQKDYDLLIYPDLNSIEKFSMIYIIKKDLVDSMSDSNKLSLLIIFNFTERNYITQFNKSDFSNCIESYIDFFYLIKKSYRDDRNIISLRINECFAYVIYILSIRSFPIFIIDHNFLRMINFNPDEFYFVKNVIRILNEMRICDYVLIMVVNSELEKEKFINEIKNCDLFCEDINDIKIIEKNIIILVESEFNDNEIKDLFHHCNLGRYIKEIKKINFSHDDLDDTNSNFLNILKNEISHINSKVTKNHDKLVMSNIEKFNDKFEKISIKGKISGEYFYHKIFNSSYINKFIISSSDKIYSNFALSNEDKIFHPIEIELEKISHFIYPNYSENFKLLSQLKHVLSHQNFILTNIKDLNPTIIIKLVNTLEEFVQLIDTLSLTKLKRQNFIIFTQNLTKCELLEILNKYNFYHKSNNNNVIFSFHDEYEFNYYFVLDKENVYDEIFYEEYEEIITELKNSKISAVSNFYLNNKMSLDKEKIFYDTHKLKEK